MQKTYSASLRRSLLVRTLKMAVAILVVTLAGVIVTNVATAQPADAPRSAKAHVIVQFGDHDLAARAINFTAPISGLRALELTGIPVVTASFGWGTAVCSIAGVGCPASDCFCGGSTQMRGNYYFIAFKINTFIDSPGSTTGLRELASSLIFRTEIP